MALNLNKGNDDKKPEDSKKGPGRLNLQKSEGSSSSKLNLSKDDSFKTQGNLQETGVENSKNSGNIGRWLVVLGLFLVFGIGAYFFVNRDSDSSSNTTDDGLNTVGTETNNSDSITITPQVDSNNVTPKLVDENSKSIKTEGTSTNASQGFGDKTSITGTNSSSQQQSTSISKSDSETSNNSVDQTLELQGTIEDKARLIIRGVFGNGLERKRALGNQYTELQAKVNEILRTNN